MAKIARKTVDVTQQLVTIKFADGSEITGKLPDLPEAIVTQLALHGLSQKLGDSYAGASSIGEAIGNAKAVYDALSRGDWSPTGQARGGIWAQALAKAQGVTVAEAAEKWAALDDEQKKAVKAHPAVRAAKAELDLERAQKEREQAAQGESVEDLEDLFGATPEMLRKQAW